MVEDLRFTDDTCNLRAEWIARASVKNLIDRCTDQKLTPPDKPEYY